ERRIAREPRAHALADEHPDLGGDLGAVRRVARALGMKERRIDGQRRRGRDLAAPRVIGEADIAYLAHREAAEGHRIAARERARLAVEGDLVEEGALAGGGVDGLALEAAEMPRLAAPSGLHDDGRARQE